MFSASPVTCQFELTRATRIFYSGDRVCGKITLTATKKLHLEGIFLNVVGFEHTQWSEFKKEIPIIYDDSSTHSATDNKIHFMGSKEYILANVQLSEGVVVQPGEFVAQFNVNLPDQLLATCKQSNGYVDYHLQVILQQKTHVKKIFQERLFVRNRLDLNMEPHLKKPYILSSTLLNNELTIIVPQTGFVPGQHIPFSIKMTQLLYDAKIVINLCQKTIYAAQMPSSKSKEVIKVHDYHIVTTAGSRLLRVPFTTAISTTLDDVLMKISYYLECLVLNEKLEIVLRKLIPITIGTVALKDSKQFTEDGTQRLHSYDNLGVTESELDDVVQYNFVGLDFTACAQQKCLRYTKKRSLMVRKRDLQNLCTKLYSKIVT